MLSRQVNGTWRQQEITDIQWEEDLRVTCSPTQQAEANFFFTADFDRRHF